MSYAGKKVLVTGGSGFVGTHLVAALLAEGARVRVPLHQRPLAVPDTRVETLRADLSRPEDCRAAARGMEYVFHAAGAVAAAATTVSNPMAAITANLVLTAQVLQGAWQEGVERCLIFSSSTGYPAADHPVREDEMWSGPTYPAYFGYGWMRRYLERIGEFVHSKGKVKVSIVRPTAVYGRWDDFDPVTGHVVPALVRRAVERKDPYEVWGTGDEVRDFLHVTDLARGCLLALERLATCDPVNVGYGKPVTIREVVRVILEAAGHARAKVVFNPSGPTTIPLRMVDISKARALLGFEPAMTLEEGLRDTVSWYAGRAKAGVS